MANGKGIDRCDSPIERALALAFSRQSRFEWRSDADHEWEVGCWPGWWMVLLSQVSMGPYRVDFAITSTHPLDDGNIPWMVIIECDGHDFHERTNEQAERDKKRDRFLTSTGATVIRFTGREIHRDPDACAVEAWNRAAFGFQQDHVWRYMTEYLVDGVLKDQWSAFETMLDWIYEGRCGVESFNESWEVMRAAQLRRIEENNKR